MFGSPLEQILLTVESPDAKLEDEGLFLKGKKKPFLDVTQSLHFMTWGLSFS